MREPVIIPIEPIINPNEYLLEGSSIRNITQVIVNSKEQIVIHCAV